MTTAIDVWIEFRRDSYTLNSRVKALIEKMQTEPSGVRYPNIGLWMYGMGALGLCELLHNSYYDQQYGMFCYLMERKVPLDLIPLRRNPQFTKFNDMLPPPIATCPETAPYQTRIVTLIERLAGLPCTPENQDKVRRLENILITAVEEQICCFGIKAGGLCYMLIINEEPVPIFLDITVAMTERW